MDWIHTYQLFLFDLDGLLVNSESLHYLAYKKMLEKRGFNLPWDFPRYCMTAHYHSDKIAQELQELFPSLYASGDTWEDLYAEKKQIMADLLSEGQVTLMPGVQELLIEIQKAQISSCVVTHSPDVLVSIIRSQHPILNKIPFWVTRFDYQRPKPHPECYLKAIKEYSQPSENIIGFEDSPRGLTALLGTRAKPVLISSINYPEIPQFLERGALHYSSFTEILADKEL